MDDFIEFNLLMKNCQKCSLSTTRTHVVVGDYGPTEGICFIGEGPGYYEDIKGRPFVGKSGSLLDKMLKKINLSRSTVSVLNIVKCRPPNNRNPSSIEQDTCGDSWLLQQIDYLQPKLIVPLGKTAFNYFIPSKSITKSNAKLFYSISGTPIFPLFHPSYVLRSGMKMEESYETSFRAMLSVYERLSKIASNEKSNQKSKLDNETSLDDFF